MRIVKAALCVEYKYTSRIDFVAGRSGSKTPTVALMSENKKNEIKLIRMI